LRFPKLYKVPTMASRVTPLCWATARRIEMSVPSRTGSCSGIAIRLVSRFQRLQNYVAADLMHLRVLPAPTQNIREMRAGDVAWDLHATDKISSRTKWRRTRSGRGRSK